MRKLTAFVTALFTSFSSTATANEYTELASSSNWKVLLWIGEDNDMTCDLTISYTDIKLSIDFWSDGNITQNVYIFGNDKVPSRSTDYTVRFGSGSPIVFRQANDDNQHISWTQDPSAGNWTRIIKGLSSGEIMYVLIPTQDQIYSIDTYGANELMEPWADCIEKLYNGSSS